jgi:AhpD family alkylhydroperoxidase
LRGRSRGKLTYRSLDAPNASGGTFVSTIQRVQNPENNSRVKAVFDDIRATRGSDFINNLWHYLAFDPALLEETWRDVKAVMATPTLLDPKTKEMIYIAVSIANSCPYCIHSHTASAKAKGMTDAEHAELLRIVTTAARTNHLLNGLQIPIDEKFDAESR